ncbi:MAG: AAA family ATPase [Candidatus Fermentibacteraceae bacterium]|nr:AAA family ATPase [Candidatus Fermentibacteraceae bacterium]
MTGLRGVLVGREHQLSSAIRFADRLELERVSGIIRIWAPPGMGKTRLALEIERSMPCRRFLFLRGDPSPGFSVFGTFLEEWFGLSPRMDPEWNRSAFESTWEGFMMVPAAGRREMEGFRPFLESLAGLSPDPGILKLEPEQRWERTAESLAGFFDLLASGSPLAVVMEDLQWFTADELSVAAKIIAGGTAPSRLFILTGRPDRDGFPPEIPGVPPLLESLVLELEGLTGDRIPEFLAGLGFEPADEGLVDYLWSTAGGIPLFLQQAVDFLSGTGSLGTDDGIVSLAVPREVLPSSIREIFSSRLDLLPPSSMKIAAAASILGSTFPLSQLHSMVAPEVWSEGSGGDHLKGILHFDVGEGSFDHLLLREWTAERVPVGELSSLHLMAAAALREESEAVVSPSRLERMANHYLLGGNEREGVRLLEKAAEGYAGEFRNASAARLYRRLIPLLEEPRRTAMELDLYDVYKNGGLLRDGIELLSGTLDRIGSDTAGAGYDLKPLVEMRLGECLGSAGELQQAEEMVQRALDAFSSAGDLENQAKAERQLGMITMSAGRTEEALEIIGRSVALARETGSARLLCAALYWAAIAFRQVGDHERMEACTLEQVELAGKSGLTRSIIAGYDNLMRIHIYRRDYDAAEEVHEKLREAAEETGNWAALNTAASKMGIIHLRRGETGKAAECFRRCAGLSEKTGNIRARCAALGNLAHAFIEMKDPASAMKYATELIDTAGRIGFRSGLMSGYARMGYIFTMMGDHHSALECLETQIEHARALKDSRNLSDGWATIAEIQFIMSDIRGALSSIDLALEHSGSAGDMLLYGSQLAQRGRYLFYSGNPDGATGSLQEALEVNGDRKGREHVVLRCRMYLDALAGRDVLCLLREELQPEVQAEVHFCRWKVTGDPGSAQRARAILESAGVPRTHPMFRLLPPGTGH